MFNRLDINYFFVKFNLHVKVITIIIIIIIFYLSHGITCELPEELFLYLV